MDSYSGKYENFYGEDNDGFYFNLRLNEGQKIYLKMHSDAYCSVSQAISILIDDEPFENAIHIHRYLMKHENKRGFLFLSMMILHLKKNNNIFQSTSMKMIR